jgi:hypothetical protein
MVPRRSPNPGRTLSGAGLPRCQRKRQTGFACDTAPHVRLGPLAHDVGVSP